jgi:hypothetical protein
LPFESNYRHLIPRSIQSANYLLRQKIVSNYLYKKSAIAYCRSCGETKVTAKKCSQHKIKIVLPDVEYNQPVRCCDFCYSHIVNGDFNSLIRYLMILSGAESTDGMKLKAAKALYLSISHERLWSEEDNIARGATHPVNLRYPALYELIELEDLMNFGHLYYLI